MVFRLDYIQRPNRRRMGAASRALKSGTVAGPSISDDWANPSGTYSSSSGSNDESGSVSVDLSGTGSAVWDSAGTDVGKTT